MKPKFLLWLALVLSSSFDLSRATETNAIEATNLSVVKIVNPQSSIDLPKLGHAVFREQSSNFSLQVPIGFRNDGEKLPASNSNTLDLQVWLLKTDGGSIAQSDKPTMVSIGTFSDFVTDYMIYQFQKVPISELFGVVVSMNGKLYCREIEMSNSKPPSAHDDGDIFQISPTNIFDSPISVYVINADSSERFTVFYKTDKTSDKFLDARLEVSDAGCIISSEQVQKIWTTNGFRFEFNTGDVWPFKFKIFEAGHNRETVMPGFKGYWFYLRDFVTNTSTAANADKIINNDDARMGVIKMPGLNELISFTQQPTQFTVQMTVASYRDDEKHTHPKVEELHRQAWLLRADGTSIPQSQKPMVGGFGNGGYEEDDLIFIFQRKSTNDVAGLVVSVEGKLFCEKLSNDWNKR